MKKFLKFGVLLGFIVILALGGYMFFYLKDAKQQAENAINEMMENQKQAMQKANIRLEFDAFKCGGLFYVECKSSKIEFFENLSRIGERPLLVLSDVSLALKDVDSKSLTLEYLSKLDYLQKEGLDDYFDILMPKTVQSNLKIVLDGEDSFIVEAHWLFDAKNINYVFDTNQRIVSKQLKEQGLLNYIKEAQFDYQSFYLRGAKIEFNANQLDQALFEVVKKQYGDLDFDGYKGLVGLMTGLSVEQFSSEPVIQQAIIGIKELAMGEKTKLVFDLNLSQEIDLTKQSDWKKLPLHQIKIQSFNQ